MLRETAHLTKGLELADVLKRKDETSCEEHVILQRHVFVFILFMWNLYHVQWQQTNKIKNLVKECAYGALAQKK